MNKITVQANANIALIKYWGKRDERLFLPTKSSLSVTLSGLKTTTTISFSENSFDEIFLNGEKTDGKAGQKVISYIDLFRQIYGINKFFKIESENNFPTGAGLASSASGFAALAKGLAEICELNLSNKELSILARRGSGSACRSIFGGFAIWHKGLEEDGRDSFAEQLFTENHWPEFRILVVVIQEEEKKISSREGMQTTVKTSPSYGKWLLDSEKRIPEIIDGIRKKDIEKVGEIAEGDALDMHHCMQDSVPSINYWKPETLEIMKTVHVLREQGIPCYFTIDAGPNVKIICLSKDQDKVLEKVNLKKGVKKVIS